MRAWQAANYGSYKDQLSLVEIDPPPIGKEDVLVEVHASSVIFADLLTIGGTYQVKPPPPFVPGFEAAGPIIDAGSDCKLEVGQRVMTASVQGAWAEYHASPSYRTYPIPDEMSYVDAAAFLINYQTAYFSLVHRAQLKKDEYLLVHGGAGGVGTAAIQLGRHLGANVIATAGTAPKLEVCSRCGAGRAIDYREHDFVEAVLDYTNGRGADVVFDPVGGEVFDRTTKCIAMDGRIVVVGFAGGRVPELKMNRLLVKNFTVSGFYLGGYRENKLELYLKYQNILFDLYLKGALSPVIYKEYPMDELLAALEAIETRESYGKVILKNR